MTTLCMYSLFYCWFGNTLKQKPAGKIQLRDYVPCNLMLYLHHPHFSLLTLYHTIPILNDHEKNFENIVGKGENASNYHFLLYPQCFRPI